MTPASRDDTQTVHDLKTWPEYFTALASGRKTFEVRKDDRGFREGDRLLLREWRPDTEQYTGATVEATVSYVLRDYPALQPGYVVLGLRADHAPAVRELVAALRIRGTRKSVCIGDDYKIGVVVKGPFVLISVAERDALCDALDALGAPTLLTPDEQDEIWMAINASVRPLPNAQPGYFCEHCRETFPFEHPRTDCAISRARDLFAGLLNQLAPATQEPAKTCHWCKGPLCACGRCHHYGVCNAGFLRNFDCPDAPREPQP